MAPKQRTDLVAPTDAAETAVSIMDDETRADLLRAQQESLGDAMELPKIVILGAAAGKYDFPDEEDYTVSTFKAVILGYHPENALWTEKMDPNRRLEPGDEGRRPACSSPDGKYGTPRPGFKHEALGFVAAEGTELIECGTCPYNKFGSGAKFIPDKNPRGKAVGNHYKLYLWIPDRMLPFTLRLNTMSIPNFTDYVKKMTRRTQPIQSIITTFRQVIEDRNGTKYGIATFEPGEPLGAQAFAEVRKMYNQYKSRIEPAPQVQIARASVAPAPAAPTLEEGDFTVEDAAKIPVDSAQTQVPF